MKKPQSYALLQLQKERKPLTKTEYLQGTTKECEFIKPPLSYMEQLRLADGKYVYLNKLANNQDRWLDDKVRGNMFPVIEPPVFIWVDRWLFNNSCIIPMFYGIIIAYFLLMFFVRR